MYEPSSEMIMLDTRRCFLKNLAGVSSSFLLFQSPAPIPEPRRRLPIDPPEPAEKQDTDNPVPSQSRTARRAQLQSQEKQFRETMTRLFTKVNDLKLQVDALHPSQVFSVAVFKQTQEIEKLAKQLKTYAKP
jgi:hypothetical protein